MPKRKPPQKTNGELGLPRCCICESPLHKYEMPEYAFDLGCCEVCAPRRIKNLIAQERAIHGLTVALTNLALIGHIGKLPHKENT
jgi:hypothetical protein